LSPPGHLTALYCRCSSCALLGSNQSHFCRFPPVPAELLKLVQELHEQQPRRTAPVLGPDGAPQAYAKRRFAADFRDNPAGDFLVSLDLQDDDGGGATLAPAGSGADAGEQPPAPPPLLELALGLLLHTAAASGSTAVLLYRQGLFSLCQELCGYCSPGVVAAAQRLYGAVADRSAMRGRVPALLAPSLSSA
jgi:hypothetical protein